MSSAPRSSAAVYAAALERVASLGRRHATLADVLEERARTDGTRPALISAAGTLSYGDLAADARRYARWARAAGVSAGGRVGLLMGGRPEYLAAWIGLSRVGARVALLNPELEADGVAHALSASGGRLILCDAERLAKAEAAQALFGKTSEVILVGRRPGGAARDQIDLSTLDPGPLEDRGDAPSPDEEALQIFTSGTTGLPKAARVSHGRILGWSGWFSGMMEIAPEDRLYDCLPLHHSVGGVASLGAVLASGASAVIRPRFSARAFWEEVVRFDCTLFQYIGELCRYLLAAAPAGPVPPHRLRLACGNGLAPDLWRPFQERFRIPRILEFYAATEASFSLFNVEGKVGSVGRIPGFLAHRAPLALIEVDPETLEPVRGDDGFCKRVPRGAAGEAVAKISAAGPGRFEGYADAEATRRKVLTGAFAAGDAWYRSGDLLRQDEEGFYYFVDRLGETFRWKGENVSTGEVQAALAACPGVRQALVFGVRAGPLEGRAGMAVVVGEEGLDLEAVRTALARRLPSFALPVFWRLTGALLTTPTFKPTRAPYLAAGFDPAKTDDPLFLAPPKGAPLVPIDTAVFEALTAGRTKL